MGMSKRLITALVAFFMVIAGFAGVATTTASAQTNETCYETYTIPAVAPVTHVEYRYIKTVDEFKTQYEVDKFTRERTRTYIQGFWQEFSPNESHHTFQGPPSWPTDPRGTWSAYKTTGGPQQNTYGVFQNGGGNGSWFYRQQSSYSAWSEWSTPTRWLPKGSHLAWVDSIAAPNWQDHDGNGDNGTYDRDWAILGTGNTRQVKTGSHVEDSGWVLTELSSPWGFVEERTVIDVEGQPETTGQREIECPIEETTTTTTQETTTTVQDTTTSNEATTTTQKATTTTAGETTTTAAPTTTVDLGTTTTVVSADTAPTPPSQDTVVTTPSSPDLPSTGFEMNELIWKGMIALGFGVFLIMAVRRPTPRN